MLIQYISRPKHKWNYKMLNNYKYIVEATVEGNKKLNLYHEKGKDSEIDQKQINFELAEPIPMVTFS